MKNKQSILPLLFLLSLLLAACGTLEMGVEATTAPDSQIVATSAALATENAHLSAQATALAETAIDSPLPLALTTIVSSTGGPSEPQVVLVEVGSPTTETLTITGTVGCSPSSSR